MANKMKNILLSLAVCIVFSGCGRSDDRLMMVVGTYTDTGSEGLYSCSLDLRTGEIELLDSCRAVNPSYLVFSEDGSMIYAVNELESGDAGVCALRFDRRDGSFRAINGGATQGAAPCYISTNGKIAVTANYVGGSMSVLPLGVDGALEPLSQLFEGSAGGPDAERQESPHVHCAVFSPDGRHLYASDFSADRILVFDVSEDGCSVTSACSADVQADYGPRHIVFDASGRHAYVIGELSGLITVFDVSEEGALAVRQVVDADPYDGRGSSDIHLSPDGRYLYASNRLKGDGISIFSVDGESGELTVAGYCFTGAHPRHFNITPDGRWLLCACRDTDEVEVYAVSPEDGSLRATGRGIGLKRPVCVQFAR